MNTVHAPIFLPDPEATSALAQALAPLLRAGDCLLLEGQIGAGKTHFARALIQEFTAEDVPSPTFTLVQTYDAPEFEIWHADLYRLSHPDEAIELGLIEAFETALCLIEWPEKLGDDAPKQALTLQLVPESEGRRVEFLSPAPQWQQRLKALDDV
ncbi:tRNA (adenosine(37)-N6)-threonylcarbamoyltransferase complex ATPase subunit type 1 TsaE [Pararhodobacter oceanensis]|uniref:tRNA threonylcarbamoyladenosine biosynthesis protein TsaE n=1 Tax=Pararhodobacter oceanensis TaxID=2172121 RepID=A0A2T8HSE5_9RHOB|nr:tRNA (adenosine(37)-N6)-threonylcarbamoyltransferase complex ATPase subunit type 1 TsaE [Pararhodobacter oceanensis]PVH28366.1 tRNA (adenosine(37)-N6)-threonylcarbamoyltransferase complex ATPase subunit type 1 TsaE [Pararhodobacter oceanensis]